MIQTLLDDLKATWDFGPEELADIKEKMVSLAMAVCFDSQIRDEVHKLSAEQE
jgi:hypothetical protein